MPDVTKEQVHEALRQVIDPDLGRDIVSLGFVTNLAVCDGIVKATINLTTPACPVKDQLKAQAEDVIRKVPVVRQANVEMTAVFKAQEGPPRTIAPACWAHSSWSLPPPPAAGAQPALANTATAAASADHMAARGLTNEPCCCAIDGLPANTRGAASAV